MRTATAAIHLKRSARRRRPTTTNARRGTSTGAQRLAVDGYGRLEKWPLKITVSGFTSTLAAREKVTTSGRFIWSSEDDTIDGRAAFVTKAACPAATLVCGDFSMATLGTWGNVQVEVTTVPQAQAAFMAGITSVRILLGCDIVYRVPSAFFVINGIS